MYQGIISFQPGKIFSCVNIRSLLCGVLVHKYVFSPFSGSSLPLGRCFFSGSILHFSLCIHPYFFSEYYTLHLSSSPASLLKSLACVFTLIFFPEYCTLHLFSSPASLLFPFFPSLLQLFCYSFISFFSPGSVAVDYRPAPARP